MAALGLGAMCADAWAEMAKHPFSGAALPRWEKGHFRISMLYNGRGETSFLVFPDSTSMLIDCGDYVFRGRDTVRHLPGTSRRAGEWTARYVLAENPNGKKVDYFMLSHYHSDHAGGLPFCAGRAPSGKYSIGGIGQVINLLDFGKFIDRSWPDMDDPAPRKDSFDDFTVKHVREVYQEVERRGIKVEKFRLEKNSDQIKLVHGGCGNFAFTPLCSNGLVLRRDGTILDLSAIAGSNGTPRSKFSENALSIGLVFSFGDFRYYTAGDFGGSVRGKDGSKNIEDALASECPQVDVAKVNHHGHHSMPISLVNALHARLILCGVWHKQHMNRPTMRRLATAKWPCLYAPCLFPKSRRAADAAEPWLKDFAPESFSGVHAVVDVAPDGTSYRLMMVDAADEKRTVIGAYDFMTSKKTV
jgi:beta-lactamase superfamily II metal-dependent hydrolase